MLQLPSDGASNSDGVEWDPISTVFKSGRVDPMANSEHVAILKRGGNAWNTWRNGHPEIRPDLSNLDTLDEFGNARSAFVFRGINLKEANLCGATFTRQKMLHSDLRSADITAAKFSRADLRGADLSLVQGRGVDLSGANLGAADLSKATLRAAIFTRAWFYGTVLIDVDLTDAVGLETCEHYGPSHINDRAVLRSGRVPTEFLRGCGVEETVIRTLSDVVRSVRYSSCFISYSHADKTFARRLHDALQVQGIRCWLDEKELHPGDDISDNVDHGIRESDKFLLCCSKHSLRPDSWVDKEIATALEKEGQLTRQRGKRVLLLIPLNLDGYLFGAEWTGSYRAEIRRRLAADFTNWQTDDGNFATQVQNVIRALRAE
ncbi:MAG: toll/interleukin-1 receptor domain-containing protein [Bryobacteraceae bacterium]